MKNDNSMNRRDLFKFLGYASAGSLLSVPLLQSCQQSSSKILSLSKISQLKNKENIKSDELTLIDGLNYQFIISFGEKINSNESFGYNNDFISFLKIDESKALLWINHEYVHPLFVSSMDRTKENIQKEMKCVGGSILEITKNNGFWKVNLESKLNRRIDANTPIPFSNNFKIKNKTEAIGTLANCAGGQTPWKTFLTCEENVEIFYGEYDKNNSFVQSELGWEKYFNYPLEHYGYVVEVDPFTDKIKKHIQMGRFAHESATVVKSKNGKICVYMGDDRENECLYKFISDSSDSLDKGKLYVASLEKKKWISLMIEDQSILQKSFKDQLDIYINTRKAAKMVGGSELDRPEDIEFDHLTQTIFVALTNNKKKGNFHGSILKLVEKDFDSESLDFHFEYFLSGGELSGLSCPDNMITDLNGNLWVTTDISGSSMNKSPYEQYGNNAFFFIGRFGPYAGQIIKLAIAPNDAEFTGPAFDDNYSNLFLSVQHPGETSTNLNELTSHWPTGNIPKPAVIAINGPLLSELLRKV